jgi:DNA-binding NarL/FixJ family response regulator
MLQKVATRPIIRGPANAPLKVLVAHSQGNSATSSLSRALHAAGNLEIAATVTTAPDALEVGQQLVPDVAIIDLELSPSDRPYRSAMRTEDALTILRHEAGKAYDPIMVDAVIKVAA